MASKTKLDLLLAWLYDQVDPEDRDKLSHRFETITAPVGPDQTFASYTAIIFEANGEAHHASLNALLDSRQAVSVLAIDLATTLHVKVSRAMFNEALLDDPVPEIPWVGEPWPERSSETSQDCYHPRRVPAIPKIEDGQVYQHPSGGLFIARSKYVLWTRSWWFEKQLEVK